MEKLVYHYQQVIRTAWSFLQLRCIFFYYYHSHLPVFCLRTTGIVKGSMDNEMDKHERKLRITSWLYAYSEGKMELSDVMKIAGYETLDRKGGYCISMCIVRDT